MKIKAINVILITMNCVNTWVHRMEGKEEMSWFEKNRDNILESAALCSPYNMITIAIFGYSKAYQDDMNIYWHLLTVSVLHCVTYRVTFLVQEKLQFQQKWLSSSVTGTRWVVFTVVFTT